ncbi:MAG: hypothetical protein CVU90_14645 [Firmicutes bacterium HGW-Firmicutes-15]|nr:MAG: hypothetical protein CVU90_14645 [Firmicutes bacterium HGW-Firmicutes-15]
MSLFTEILVRVSIIVAVTNLIEFYVISRKHMEMTLLLCVEIIAITVIPIVINVWYSFYTRGINLGDFIK